MNHYHYLLLDTDVDGTRRYDIAAAVLYDETEVILDSFVDLCLTKAPVAELVELCNALELDPIHLHDVIDDFVAMF